jgi:CRP/FNR family transcriptional regulator
MKNLQITPTLKSRINTLLDGIIESDLIDLLLHHGKLFKVEQDEHILHVGDKMLTIPIVLQGSIKVIRENTQGDELLLYYIEGGDTCAMTLQCCMRQSVSEVKAIAVENSTILMIPLIFMETWMEKFKSWREYILQSYHSRMMELLETVDAIAFMNLDERLQKHLIDQAKLTGSLELNVTHQQIAEELNSSRVVISRLLKQLEMKGSIKLKRNKIILDSI